MDRYDLQTQTWTTAQAPAIGYHIAPVDDSHVLLLGTDQWVDLTLNTYAPGAMTQLSKISWATRETLSMAGDQSHLFQRDGAFFGEH